MPDPPPGASTSGPARRLTAAQLAVEARVTPEYVAELVNAGAIRPDGDGSHDPVDVATIRFAVALGAGGIDVDDLMWVIQSGGHPLHRIGQMWNAPESTGRTTADFVASLGERGADLPAIYAAFGLAAPPQDALTRRDEEAVLTDFLDIWSMVDSRLEVSLRAAHIVGEGVRRIQEATLDLFDEFEGSPPPRFRRGLDEDEALRPSIRLTPLMSSLLVWLLVRHSEHEAFERMVDDVQGTLARAGRMPAREVQRPAIAFVDLTGYTELTAAAGDEHAADLAGTLQVLAGSAAANHRGRIVKLLGDGVMLRYPSDVDAIRSVQELMADILQAGLPAAHAGVAAGPIVIRDGDVYGSTVNLAARISARAPAGELLVPADVAQSIAAAGFQTEDAGETQLKGIADPVSLARVISGPGEAASRR